MIPAIPLPEDPITSIVEILGLAVLSAATAGTAAFAYRWYARERIPEGLAMLAGLGAVAGSMGTRRALEQFVGGGAASLTEMLPNVVENTAAFLVAIAVALLAALLGDRLATDTTAIARKDVDADVSRIVRAVGRVITVTLPDDIEDMDGYDPVAPEKKEELSGTTLVFPRGLTVAELGERVADRLKDDYGVGHVDVDVTVEGDVEFLALGSRAAGLGPTLAPGTAAVAIRADPPAGASPGDTIQVWRAGEDGPERLLTAELRATAGDVVTLAGDEDDVRALDPGSEYRLVTLARHLRPERQFAALLRNADETMAATAVGAESEFVGKSVDDLGGSVVAVRPAEGGIVALPSRDRTLAAGDTVYVVARPEVLRRMEAAAGDRRAVADTTSL